MGYDVIKKILGLLSLETAFCTFYGMKNEVGLLCLSSHVFKYERLIETLTAG
jgi:hypothetical protein